MHKLTAQARTFLMLHPEAYRVLYARLIGEVTYEEAAALLSFDLDTLDRVGDAALAETAALKLLARARK